MYTWSKSNTETATLRECFPTTVLLGSIQVSPTLAQILTAGLTVYVVSSLIPPATLIQLSSRIATPVYETSDTYTWPPPGPPSILCWLQAEGHHR